MESEWEQLPLSEVSVSLDTLRVPVKESERRPGQYPYYGASGIVDHVDSYLFDGDYLLVAEDGENLKSRKTPVAFMARGRFWVNNHAHVLRGNSLAETEFLCYALQIADITSFLSGSTMPKLTQGNMSKVKVFIPPIAEQRRIIGILGRIDSRIANLGSTNRTLEAIARAIFKSWFVDFDPVRAKAEGREPEGMDAVTSALFPSAFSESNLGPVPAGWNITTWGTLATLKYGKSLRDYTSTSGAYPVYGTNGKIGTCSEPLCSSAGIIIGRKGAYRGVHYSPMPFFVIDTAFYVALNASIESRWGYYSLLRQDINEIDSGSAIPSTSREDFYSLKVVAPPTALQQAFVEFLEPFWQRQEHANRESAVLSEVRDTLLPRLISGKLRVPEAEELVEAAL
jgi:type I restriction enzyme, S subunit